MSWSSARCTVTGSAALSTFAALPAPLASPVSTTVTAAAATNRLLVIGISSFAWLPSTAPIDCSRT